MTCPTCGRTDAKFLANQRRWQCKSVHPKRQFSAKVGTIFEDSPIPLEKWLPAVWMIVNDKNGISSWELHRALGVTQKTAWFMLHRNPAWQCRTSRQVKIGGNGGPVEVDETFIGGKARNMHKTSAHRLTRCPECALRRQGQSHRHGDAGTRRQGKALVIPNAARRSCKASFVMASKRALSFMTDEARMYLGLNDEYVHEIINHAEAYVERPHQHERNRKLLVTAQADADGNIR